MNASLPNGFSVEEANNYYDEELRIDLLILKDNKEFAGIQVKPKLYNYVRSEVISFSKHANSQWERKVFYLLYDSYKSFINIIDVLKEI